jgi:hypothetical protein
MDTNTAAAIATLAPFIVAPLAAALAKAAEKLPAIPYQGGSKAGIVAALTVSAVACRWALAWATGTLPGVDWAADVRLVVEALAGALMAAGGYALARNDKPALPGGN